LEDNEMTTDFKEARLAYDLWNHIIQLESILWSKYEKDFFNFISDEEKKSFVQDSLENFDEKYPF